MFKLKSATHQPNLLEIGLPIQLASNYKELAYFHKRISVEDIEQISQTSIGLYKTLAPEEATSLKKLPAMDRIRTTNRTLPEIEQHIENPRVKKDAPHKFFDKKTTCQN